MKVEGSGEVATTGAGAASFGNLPALLPSDTRWPPVLCRFAGLDSDAILSDPLAFRFVLAFFAAGLAAPAAVLLVLRFLPPVPAADGVFGVLVDDFLVGKSLDEPLVMRAGALRLRVIGNRNPGSSTPLPLSLANLVSAMLLYVWM